MRTTPHDGSGTGHGWIAQDELLKIQKSGQFPDELVKIEGVQIHYVASQLKIRPTYHRIVGVIIVRVIFSILVKNSCLDEDDFITAEYRKTRVRGEMSCYNYDPQKIDLFIMNR